MPSPLPLQLPRGFAVNAFASGLGNARNLLVTANGDVLLAESDAGRIILLRDADGAGKAEVKSVLAEGLDEPFGMAVQNGYLYVGEPRRVVRFRYRIGDPRVSGEAEAVTHGDALGSGVGHSTRSLLFSADGKRLFVTVGSASNVAEDPLPRASIQVFNADGSGQQTYASGTRNPVGIARNPATGQLWATVVERDGLGDNLPPDFLSHIVEGGFYGWPYAYAGPHPDPHFGNKRPDLVQRSIVPDILLKPHGSPLGLVFYDGAMFPADCQGDALVSLHGSWNAGEPSGYMLVRVRFKDGMPAGRGYEVFATGFRLAPANRVWGRPVGLAVAKDGALLVADDVADTVWRISYRK